MGIRNQFTSVAHPQSNGQVEVTNRAIVDGIKKKLLAAKGRWPEVLEEVLWAYRVTPRSATGKSPYELTFGMEAVTPVELMCQSPRVAHSRNAQLNNAEKAAALDELFDLRMRTSLRMVKYQRRMHKIFDAGISPRHFQPGDLVLRKREAAGRPVGKLNPNWEGPFIIVRSLEHRAYQLATTDGKTLPRTWNIENLRKFYA